MTEANNKTNQGGKVEQKKWKKVTTNVLKNLGLAGIVLSGLYAASSSSTVKNTLGNDSYVSRKLEVYKGNINKILGVGYDVEIDTAVLRKYSEQPVMYDLVEVDQEKIERQIKIDEIVTEEEESVSTDVVETPSTEKNVQKKGNTKTETIEEEDPFANGMNSAVDNSDLDKAINDVKNDLTNEKETGKKLDEEIKKKDEEIARLKKQGGK